MTIYIPPAPRWFPAKAWDRIQFAKARLVYHYLPKHRHPLDSWHRRWAKKNDILLITRKRVPFQPFEISSDQKLSGSDLKFLRFNSIESVGLTDE